MYCVETYLATARVATTSHIYETRGDVVATLLLPLPAGNAVARLELVGMLPQKPT